MGKRSWRIRFIHFQALGYICQDINASTLEGRANEILTAIVHGLRKEESSNHVRLAAANAMLNSLEFTKNNFGNEVCGAFGLQWEDEGGEGPDILFLTR